MPTELVLVRHGETSWSEERKHTGRSDIPLTDNGRAQAQHIAGALRVFDIRRCFASPLARAWETAQLIELHPDPDPDLLEWDYGDFEGLTTAEIRERSPGWSVWTHAITGGETIEQVGERADRVIGRALAFDGMTALVAHSHLLRILAARWLELPAVEGRRFTLDNATISVLGWERENRVVTRWNDPAGWE
jgi:broad specificity phosphatase PhoE